MVVCWLLLALAGCATRSGGRTSATTDAPCLSTAGASREDREALDRLLLRLGDGEALYTLAGGIKPVSSEADLVVRVAPTVDDSALASLAALRRRAALLSCGPIGAVVQLYAATYPGRGDTLTRAASLLVYHRDRMRAAIRAHAAFFATIGVTEAAAPHDVLHAVETAPRAARWRGYGYLFGYPDDAVDFFVAAGIAGDSARTLVPRDFRRLPTVRMLHRRSRRSSMPSRAVLRPRPATWRSRRRRHPSMRATSRCAPERSLPTRRARWCSGAAG